VSFSFSEPLLHIPMQQTSEDSKMWNSLKTHFNGLAIKAVPNSRKFDHGRHMGFKV
jgi:hypothetical protein